MTTLTLDLTASASENYVLGEDISLAVGSVRYVILENGYFYDKDLVVKNSATGATLNRFTDYVLQSPLVSNESLPVSAYLIIVIINPTVGNISVDSRAVGGWYALTTQSIADILNYAAGVGSVQWGDILNIPTEFFPTPHMHNARDLDWGSVISVLDNIRASLDLQFGESLSSMYSYIDQMTSSWEFYGNITNLSWGALRHTITGITFNWGTLPIDAGTAAQSASGALWECNFKKAFSVTSAAPNIIDGGSLGKYLPLELTARDADSFICRVKYNSGSSNTALSTRCYLAIGISSSATAVSNVQYSPIL